MRRVRVLVWMLAVTFPRISEERRLAAALVVLAAVSTFSVVLAVLNRPEAAGTTSVTVIEGPPSPACNALTKFNFGDQLAVQLTKPATFSASDPAAADRLSKLDALYQTVVTEASDSAELANTRLTFLRKLLRAEAVTDDERAEAQTTSEALVVAQRKVCPTVKRGAGSTTTKPKAKKPTTTTTKPTGPTKPSAS